MKQLALLTAVAAFAAGCAPNAQPVPHADIYGGPVAGHAAVDEFFPEPWLNAKAHCIANRESNEYPTSDNGTHHGLFQLADQFLGSLLSAAQTLRELPFWWSARENALAARIIYNQSGWAPWAGAGGC